MLSSQEQQHLIFHQPITPFQKFLKGANLLFLDSVMLLYHQSVNNHRVLFCFSAPPDLPLQYISCKLSNPRVTQFTEKVNKNLFLILYLVNSHPPKACCISIPCSNHSNFQYYTGRVPEIQGSRVQFILSSSKAQAGHLSWIHHLTWTSRCTFYCDHHQTKLARLISHAAASKHLLSNDNAHNLSVLLEPLKYLSNWKKVL